MEGFNHQILGQVDGATTKMTSWITCFFFLENDSVDPFVEKSVPPKRLTGWNLKNKGGLNLKVDVLFAFSNI